MPLEVYAYAVTLPTGVVARIASTREITHAVLRRVDKVWTATWCVGRLSAYRQQKRFVSELQHRSGLRPDQYEARVEPVTVSKAPELCTSVARLPGRSKARHSFRPGWGETAPIAVIAVSEGDGWKAVLWVASAEEQDREVKRLKIMHHNVMIAPAKQEMPR